MQDPSRHVIMLVRYGPARPEGLPQLRTPLDLPAKGYMSELRPPKAAVATQLIELREAASGMSGSGVGDSRGSGGVWGRSAGLCRLMVLVAGVF